MFEAARQGRYDVKLSLVTGTLNREKEFKRLVDSIVKNTTVPYEVVISDASDDLYTVDLPANFAVIIEKPRAGYVLGYNRAFKECRGTYVLWLNDDCEVLPGYDVRAINYMEANPHIGLGCLAFSDRLWSDFRVCSFWKIPYANFGIIRREIGEKIGWLWPGVEMYGSDNAITFDVLLAGHGVAAIDGPFIHHHRPEDTIRQRNQVNRERDNQRLQAKYQPLLEDLRNAYNRRMAQFA